MRVTRAAADGVWPVADAGQAVSGSLCRGHLPGWGMRQSRFPADGLQQGGEVAAHVVEQAVLHQWHRPAASLGFSRRPRCSE